MKAAYVGMKAAGHLVEDAAVHAGEDAVEHAAEHEVEDTAEHAASDAVEDGVTDCAESFAASTLVATPSGEQPIAALKVGQAVTAYNPATSSSQPQTIQAVTIHHDDNLVDVTLRVTNVASAKPAAAHGITTTATRLTHNETVHTTANHPWLTADAGWMPAGFLHIGEPVVEADGSTAVVVAVRSVPGGAQMWDLTVANVHTFAVGSGQFVVHNCDSSTIDFSNDKKINHEYDFHHSDFGVDGNRNNATKQAFRDALKAHIEDLDTVELPGGKYRGDPATHYYNPRTDLNVVTDPSGRFVAGWKLDIEQVWNVITRRSLR